MLLIWLSVLAFASVSSSLPRERRSPQYFYPVGGYQHHHPIGGYYGHPVGGFDPYRPFGRARCLLKQANNSQVMGEILLNQPQSLGPVQLVGEIVNLTPGRHGFHIHEVGDTADDCAAAGTHFNPANMKHGAPDDAQRHAGDLGNINVGASGVVAFEIVDSEISLVEGNPRNIMGRSIVVHSMEDDFGRGTDDGSMTTGNAGDRLACCVIERPVYYY